MPQLDQEKTYAALLEAYRTSPDNHTGAARAAGVNWRTAKTVWERGYRKLKLPPLRDYLIEEQQRSRALLEADRQARLKAAQVEDENSRKNAVQARKMEGQMVTMVRGSTFLALQAVTELAREAKGLAEAVNAQVAVERRRLTLWTAYDVARLAGDPTAVEPTEGRPPTLDKLLSVLNQSATYAQRITSCAREAFELERLHLGEPLATIAVVDERREVTLDELRLRRDAALHALEGAVQAGGLTVLQGGKADPVIGQRVIPR